jgi:hypothetical protein
LTLKKPRDQQVSEAGELNCPDAQGRQVEEEGEGW